MGIEQSAKQGLAPVPGWPDHEPARVNAARSAAAAKEDSHG